MTNDEANQYGYLFSKEKLDSKDWFVEFQFNVESTAYAGDGFAFWFTDKPFAPGKAFGHSETFNGLGLFFDTYKNSKTHSVNMKLDNALNFSE